MLRIPFHHLPYLVWISLMVVLGGCSTSKENVLPQEGPTMRQIYDAHFGATSSRSVDGARAMLAEQTGLTTGTRSIAPDHRDLVGYTRDTRNEIEALFPRLPNPTLVMYVFPHLAGSDGVPVPGYATTFPMYERVEYALPGEMQ
jgi:conjugative transfer region lipoprotein (TIGR03751 family)